MTTYEQLDLLFEQNHGIVKTAQVLMRNYMMERFLERIYEKIWNYKKRRFQPKREVDYFITAFTTS